MSCLARLPLFLRVCFALILGLMVAGAGAAHRPMERPTDTAALAAFVAAGGSLGDLCHDASTAGHESGHGQMECPACVLQKCGIALSQPLTLSPAILGRAKVVWPAPADQPVLILALTLPPPRGPPLPTFS